LVSAVLPAAKRPSSKKTCYTDELGHEPCLHWEDCLLNHDDGGDLMPIPVSPGRCYRSCEQAPCAPSDACTEIDLYDVDYSYTVPVCPAATPPNPWPSYPDSGPNPAEGGLDCWTTLLDTPGTNDRAFIEVVGDHMFVLTGTLGISVATGEVVSSTRLVTAPLQVGAEPLTLHDGAGEPFLWSRPRRSGDHLVVLERDTPTGQPWDEGPVTTRLLLGLPGAGGTVELGDSGQTITLHDDRGAPVSGTRHGCIVRQAAHDLELVCFPVVDGQLAVTSSALGIPKVARDVLAGKTPIQQRPWSMAASERWIAFFLGGSLHVAPFDPAADRPAGTWRTTKVPPFMPSLGAGAVVLVGDVLTASGMTTRLSACAPTDWLAGTVQERALGSTTGWTVAGDLVVLFNLLVVSGPDPPARIIATRVLW
jgi:hypothetical protein